MNTFKKLRDDYVIWHANRVKLPVFSESLEVRNRVTFSGRVQKVGFRLELCRIAQRMGLTGWVRNLEDGSVEAELQGNETKVDFLIHAMKSLRRASVTNVTVINIPLRDEEDFTIRKP